MGNLARGWLRKNALDQSNPHAALIAPAGSNLFDLCRHLVKAQHYRDLRVTAFEEWSSAVSLNRGLDSSDLKKLTCMVNLLAPARGHAAPQEGVVTKF